MHSIVELARRTFNEWEIIGVGSERCCFINPKDSSRCIKVSKKGKCSQTMRDIKYFEYLQRREIKIEELPVFYGKFETKDFIGYEQECILSKHLGGEYDSVCSIGEYIENPENDVLIIKEKLEKLKFSLMHNNIICCDLSASNVLVAKRKNELRLVVIDGYGPTEFIPLWKWKCFGKRKIERQWGRFKIRLTENFRKRFENQNHESDAD